MKPSIACLAGLLFGAQAAFCAPIDLAAIIGGVQYLKSTSFTTWPTTPLSAGGGFTVSSPDPAGNIWLFTPTTFGLTDSTFTCSDTTGCTGLQFSFIVLGELNANLASVDINLNGNAAGGSFDAQYFVTCSGPGPCLIGSPLGGPFVLSGGFSVGGSVDLVPPIGLGLANYQITWNLVPSAGGTTVPFGTTLSLPSSLEVTETPEPAMGMLVGLVLAGVSALRRKISVNR
jgi:hypothetical protein